MNILEGRGLCRRVGGKTLLVDASVALMPGELLGIIGPNGAGKSTLLRLLAGFDQPDAGQVTLGDKPLRQWSSQERARTIGYLPQHFAPHWDYRVAELLRLGLERTAGGMIGLPALAEQHGLEALLDRRWSSLSGGERGRTLAAAVLAPAPPVVLADEPAAALDIGQAAALMGLLMTQAQAGAAVAVVVHDLNLAGRWCGRLLLMDGGRILACGASGTILSEPMIDAVFGLRFERWSSTENGRIVLAPSG